ncbi:unnamed protein product [Prorocentrum cordatum]|uniref:Secreted protein n=1 Tax=Prorocentrum cordatum TaxID=2364126 RepID=A0ABN9R3Y3_9DINO|nr:unnamed protein product [Polarella glacialis]
MLCMCTLGFASQVCAPGPNWAVQWCSSVVPYSLHISFAVGAVFCSTPSCRASASTFRLSRQRQRGHASSVPPVRGGSVHGGADVGTRADSELCPASARSRTWR